MELFHSNMEHGTIVVVVVVKVRRRKGIKVMSIKRQIVPLPTPLSFSSNNISSAILFE